MDGAIFYCYWVEAESAEIAAIWSAEVRHGRPWLGEANGQKW